MLSQTDRHELHIMHHILHRKECLICYRVKEIREGSWTWLEYFTQCNAYPRQSFELESHVEGYKGTDVSRTTFWNFGSTLILIYNEFAMFKL
jgi:hypothetical protein